MRGVTAAFMAAACLVLVIFGPAAAGPGLFRLHGPAAPAVYGPVTVVTPVAARPVFFVAPAGFQQYQAPGAYAPGAVHPQALYQQAAQREAILRLAVLMALMDGQCSPDVPGNPPPVERRPPVPPPDGPAPGRPGWEDALRDKIRDQVPGWLEGGGEARGLLIPRR